jgi:excisionase family DNA binding protein
MTEAEKSPYATIEEVAKHYTVSVSTIRSWVRTGDIPKNTYIKIGQTYRFRIPLIDEALIPHSGPTA